MELNSNNNFCIIFPGFEMRDFKICNTDFEKYMDEEIEKLLSEAMPITNEFFEDKEKVELFTKIIKNYLTKIINKEIPYSIVDNIYKAFTDALI
jgi:uncharacterized protein YejL (UPF0352 family)